MKLPQAMIDRACKAYWAEAGTFVSTEERIHAALEAALSECATGTVSTVTHVSMFVDTRDQRFDLFHKRVALVPLDD